MSDTTTAEPEAASAPGPAPTPTGDEAAAPTPVATAAGVPPAATPPRDRRTVQVPVWALVLVLGLAVAVGAFFLGRATADPTSGPATLSEAVEMTARGDMEVGDFDARRLLDALRQNPNLDLGILGDLLFGNGLGNGLGNGRR